MEEAEWMEGLAEEGEEWAEDPLVIMPLFITWPAPPRPTKCPQLPVVESHPKTIGWNLPHLPTWEDPLPTTIIPTDTIPCQCRRTGP